MSLINLTACTHAVVPQAGPTMQAVYDGMRSNQNQKAIVGFNQNTQTNNLLNNNDAQFMHQQNYSMKTQSSNASAKSNREVNNNANPTNYPNNDLNLKNSNSKNLNTMNLQVKYVAILNPTLNLVVFSHLLKDGSNDVVIPTYQTQFKAYLYNHYQWQVVND